MSLLLKQAFAQRAHFLSNACWSFSMGLASRLWVRTPWRHGIAQVFEHHCIVVFLYASGQPILNLGSGLSKIVCT